MTTTTDRPRQVTQQARLAAPGAGVWFAVRHALLPGVVTYYRSADEAGEHRDRMMVRLGKKVDVEVVTGG